MKPSYEELASMLEKAERAREEATGLLREALLNLDGSGLRVRIAAFLAANK